MLLLSLIPVAQGLQCWINTLQHRGYSSLSVCNCFGKLYIFNKSVWDYWKFSIIMTLQVFGFWNVVIFAFVLCIGFAGKSLSLWNRADRCQASAHYSSVAFHILYYTVLFFNSISSHNLLFTGLSSPTEFTVKLLQLLHTVLFLWLTIDKVQAPFPFFYIQNNHNIYTMS